MKVKESEKVGLKLNIEKIKIMASGPITSWQIDQETVETVADFLFWGRLQNHCKWWSPHGLQHTGPPWPSSTPRACSHSSPSSQWYHPTISSSVIPFSSCLQSFSIPGCFPMSQFFTSGGQSIGVSALASVLPMNIQDWFPLGLIGLISFQSKGLSPGLLHCRWILYQLSCKRSRIILVTNLLLYIIGSSPPLIMPWHDLRRKGCIISRFSYVLLFATLWTVAH